MNVEEINTKNLTLETIVNFVKESYFPDAHVVDISSIENESYIECGWNEKLENGSIFHNPGEKTLLFVCECLNRYNTNPAITFSEFGYDYSGYVPAGIKVTFKF